MNLDSVAEHNVSYYSDSLVSTDDIRRIRLIRLEPGKFYDQVIACSLTTVNLDGPTRYSALSYVWGTVVNESDVKRITMNGETGFQVTLNAFAALRRLRRRDEVVTVWVDALCIKQSDTSERNSQVPMMADIFAGAEKVDVWLGTCWANQPGVINEQEFCFMQTWHDQSAKQGLKELVYNSGLPPEVPGRMWWQRSWCVGKLRKILPRHSCLLEKLQEAVVSKKLVIWLGSHTMLPEHLNLPAPSVTEQLQKFPPDAFDAADQAMTEMANINGLRLSRSCEAMFLSALLWTTATRAATNPKDKVYSIMGLVRGGNVFAERPLLVVDYDCDMDTFSCQTAYAMIQQHGRLDVIFGILSSFPRRRDHWPSWAPDVTLPRSMRGDNAEYAVWKNVWAERGFEYLTPEWSFASSGWNFTRTSRKDASMHTDFCLAHTYLDGTALSVAAIWIDVIFSVFDHGQGFGEHDWKCRFLGPDDEVLNDLSPNLAHDCLDGPPEVESKIRAHREHIEKIWAWEYLDSRDRYIQERERQRKQSGGLWDRLFEAHNTLDEMATWLHYGRYYPGLDQSFLSRSNLFGQMSTFDARPGDILMALLDKCEGAVILRPVGGAATDDTPCYRLVGLAVIPGLTDGLVDDMHQRGEVEAQTIRIV